MATEASNGSAARLWLTRSGGRDWRDVTPRRVPFQPEDLQFVDARRGWFVANDCVAFKARVYRTRDTGRTWAASLVDATNCAGGSALALTFGDRRHGWLVRTFENGSFAELDRTADGGVTWMHLPRLPILGRVTFRTSRDGWLARSDFVSPNTLYATSDGGRSWRRESVAVPRGWQTRQSYIDVPTFFGRGGVLPVTLLSGHRAAVAFEVTGDGGRTWRLRAVERVSRDLVAPGSPFARYVPAAFASRTVWWVVLSLAPPRLAVTTDGGRSWRSVRPPVLGRATTATLTAVSPRSAWLTLTARDRTQILATANSGRSWRAVPLPAG
jgi:photosystem II stability/assembly factor-like uncharacterized protein